MKSPEGYEKDEIKKYLTSIGAWFCMIPANGYGASGQPDIAACIRRLFIWRRNSPPKHLESVTNPKQWADEFCSHFALLGAEADVAEWFRCHAATEGRFWATEVKRHNKEPTVLQWRRLEAVADAGGQACWGTAEKVLKEIRAWRGEA